MHDRADHLGAHAAHVHPREAQLFRAAGHHKAKHAADKVFFHRGTLAFAQDIQPPEGEEHVHLAAHCQRAVCNDERGNRFVEVTRKYDDAFVVATGNSACGLYLFFALLQHHVKALAVKIRA
ncbi:hypothetical protein SDC9_171396 [bioreactor metagenome]|uniref:Uncharacterized protein n=1 Tax=bioreactor metagenome TaxID=1076179 RepID=A0A645GJW1_9ZZZZ